MCNRIPPASIYLYFGTLKRHHIRCHAERGLFRAKNLFCMAKQILRRKLPLLSMTIQRKYQRRATEVAKRRSLT